MRAFTAPTSNCIAARRTIGRTFAAPSAVTTMTQQVLGKGSAEPAAGPSRDNPTFITTFSCPYAQRSWIALNAKGIKYNPVLVDLQDKPEWFFKHNPYGRVPTLFWQEDGKTASLYESLIVNEFINDLPGPSLLPVDPVARAQARLIIDQVGAKWGGPFAKIMFGTDASATGPAQEELTKVLQWVEGLVNKEGPYFLGRDFSLVDAAIIPFYLRLQVLQDLGLYEIPTAELPKLTAWCEAASSHPAVQGSMQPPDASKSYMEQLKEVYVEYISRRKAAAAAAP
eukprot:gene5210-5448_t